MINILWRSVAQSDRTNQVVSHLTRPMTLVHNAPQNVNHFHAPPSTILRAVIILRHMPVADGFDSSPLSSSVEQAVKF